MNVAYFDFQTYSSSRGRRQSGFVGIVFLAIALIGIVIAAIAAMSRSSTGNTADQVDKVNASVLLKQGADYKNGYDRMLASGIDQASITFDATVGTGMFDPTPGAQYAVRQVAPVSALNIATGSNQYFYSMNASIPGVGSTASDSVVDIPNIKLSVCQQINHALYNDSVTAAPAQSFGGVTQWLGGYVNDSAITATNYVGRPEGCIKTTDNFYVYYKVMAEK